jgi:hypothetical protein
MTAPHVRDGLLVAPCVCGGEAIAAHDMPDELRNAAAYHAATREHGLWRRRRRAADEPGELIGELAVRLGGRPVRAGLLLDVALNRAGIP